MKHVVFLVHGMGVFEKDWQTEFKSAIETAYTQYGLLSAKPIDERLEFVPVSYDAIFRELVATWADNATLIGALAQETGAPVGRLTSWLKGAGELKDNFRWTHAADVLLYRGFRLVRERVCTSVAKQLMVRIAQQHTEDGRSLWSVVAHSLGTAVVHDALARMTSPNAAWPGALAFKTQNEQAKLLMMVANVSRVLEAKTTDEPYDAYLSSVKPGLSGQKGRATLYYLTARHRLDPFTIPSMFNPAEWPDQDALAAKPPRYRYIEVDHVHDGNVHDFGHYLKHPNVHIPMFRTLLSPEIIPEDEAQRARDKFRPFGPLGDQLAIEIRGRLEDILPAQSETWQLFGKLWKEFTK